MDERDARAELANRARELVQRYGLGEEYRLVQESHGRHLDSGDPRNLEDCRASAAYGAGSRRATLRRRPKAHAAWNARVVGTGSSGSNR